jgi:hypothetical protein
MSIARALAMLGTGAGAFGQGQDQARDQARRDAEDARRQRDQEWQDKVRARQEKKWADEDAETADVQARAAPVAAKPDLAPDQVGPPAFQVNGATIADPAAAEAAAAAQNTPAARMRRAAGGFRDPTKAAAMEASAAQADVTGMQLEAAKRAEAVRVFDDGIRKAAGSWDGLAKFLSDSAADGKDGTIKFATKKEGGKVTLYPVGPDGTALGTGSAFDDNEEGRARAAFMFARGTSPEQKLNHLRAEAKDKAAAEDKTTDNKRQAERDAEIVRHNKAMEGHASATERRLAEASSAAAAGGGIPIKDVMPTLNRVGDLMDKEMKIGSDTADTNTPEGKAAEAARVQQGEALKTTAQRLVMGAAQVGMPITAEIAIQTVRSGKVHDQQIRNPATGELAIVKAMEVGGRLVPLAIMSTTPETIGGGRGTIIPPKIGEQPPPPRMSAAATTPQPRPGRRAIPGAARLVEPWNQPQGGY